ncbi:hypothetical protein K1W69_05715 [Hoeflea sp. WL0058]|uniref:Uncharacterized protein n=1 Tax=Flavimaribacter sediminis TaxID=2865987 RepID=A0AAE3D068_9HYPH|nr:hypothetical protein [Flavimaribacter sediminis]MBW8636682.1 hypothetical protein [Flavimaribacter sediminis]
MEKGTTKAQIQEIVTDRTKSPEEQLQLLEKMRQEVRAEMRAATESPMVDDNDLGAELKLVEEAIESIDPDAESTQETGAATL